MMWSGSMNHAPEGVLAIKTTFDTAYNEIFWGNIKEMCLFHIFSSPIIYYFLKTISNTIFSKMNTIQVILKLKLILKLKH